ncbi:hypothetical protein HYQ46_009623 [Verticillium longisporum]|nr:hypothetical protein HYQ46_009623 [Verticillium longisporum]
MFSPAGVSRKHLNRSAIQPASFVGGILNLQARLDVLHRRSDEADGRAGHNPGHPVAIPRQRALARVEWRAWMEIGDVEDILRKQAPVDGQGTQHDRVHEHPADKRRRGALVEGENSFISDGLSDALERPREAAGVCCLKPDFDSVKGMSDYATH